MRGSFVEPPRLDYMMLDPVMNHAYVYAKLFGHLLDGQFCVFLELRGRNFITPTDPVNRLSRKGEPLRGTVAFSIKLISNLCLRQTVRQLANSIDLRGGNRKTVGAFGGGLHGRTGAS